MKKIIILLIALTFLFSCSNNRDNFVGLWNKDLNLTYDTTAFSLWTAKGAMLPVDNKIITTPVFIRIVKEGEFYKLVGYNLDFMKRQLIADVTLPENLRFKKFDDITLVSDNEAANASIEEKLPPYAPLGLPKVDKKPKVDYFYMFSNFSN